jgi:hypothetical protein
MLHLACSLDGPTCDLDTQAEVVISVPTAQERVPLCRLVAALGSLPLCIGLCGPGPRPGPTKTVTTASQQVTRQECWLKMH